MSFDRSCTNASCIAHWVQIEAMKRDAATSAEDFATQQSTAKSTADAEAARLQKSLNETKAALEQQQNFTKRLEADAQRIKEELQASLTTREELVRNNRGLTQVSVKCTQDRGLNQHREQEQAYGDVLLLGYEPNLNKPCTLVSS